MDLDGAVDIVSPIPFGRLLHVERALCSCCHHRVARITAPLAYLRRHRFAEQAPTDVF